MIDLRDGTLVDGLNFDVIFEHDPRSDNYMMPPVEARPTHGRHWRTHHRYDQGSSGMCVMHAIAHALASDPTVRRMNKAQIIQGHALAQSLDTYPNDGMRYGTSLNAGCKAARQMGFIKGWRWIADTDQAANVLAGEGPVVFVVDWPGPTGLHAVASTLYAPKAGNLEGPNSWGSSSWWKFNLPTLHKIFRQAVFLVY